MDEEEIKKPSAHVVGMVLDDMSVDELTERVALLEGEIARLKQAIESRGSSRAAADAVFKI
ncbi:DUF1192 domain-containing protein [Cucumibacter marinus]|uniref:DUF1192 domain-containing protein n=1 Tax=Cucumibacter marinus TaxID=1121252 RepID=UPI000427CC53|nr:DUF1192 domain-containing protein [Cucumibacter marinus]